MRRLGVVCAALFACLFQPLAHGQDHSTRLVFAERPRLINCDPATSIPCFRTKLNLVDSMGNPVSVELPGPQDLTKNVALSVDGKSAQAFYASAEAGSQSVKSRIALLVIDVSGSMNALLPSGETRFQAAKSAALGFLQNFENGVDRVGIVPFASRSVEATIRGVSFVKSAEEARREAEQLPLPMPKNNTALYSAVRAAVERLTQELRTVEGRSEAVLLILTDGENDIRPRDGDDPGLLEGAAGLEEAARAVQGAGFQVVSVGFGDSKSIDEAALRKIGTQTYVVQSPERLKQAFTFTRTLLNNRMIASFQSPIPDRVSLAGRNLQMQVSLNLPGGAKLMSNTFVWSTPQIGIPAYEGRCDEAESRTLLSKPPQTWSWWNALRPIVAFVSFGALLAALWWLLPRLLWPEIYNGVGPPPERWAGTSRSVSFRPAPPGFDSGSKRPSRTSGDVTIPGKGFDPNRTRLS
jgi:hypothetical protein